MPASPRSRLAFLPALLLLFAAPAAGQPAPAQPVALPDSVVVTASRTEEAARRTGRRLTVWTARDLAALPVASVDELLRTVGGVEVQSRGGFGVQSDLTMRGSTFNGVLVLLDGARLNDPMTGHFLTDLPLPVSALARVEVLRGPATALYGPDAVGGVIHLFTHAGLRTADGFARRPEAQAVLETGRHGTYGLDLSARGATARTAFSAATTWQGTDGQPLRDTDDQTVRRGDQTLRADFSRRAHTAAVVHRLGDATVLARAGYDARDFGAYHFYTPFASDTAREATATTWAQVRVHAAAARTRWEAQVAARRHEDTYVYNPQTPANHHVSRLLTAQVQASRPVAAALHLTAGASAQGRSIDSNNLGVHDDASAGVFVLGRWQPLAALTLHAGGRADYDPAYDVAWTPQASLAYQLPGATLRAAVGRAVRAPNYVERYFNTTLARPRGRSLGNPALRPEHSWSYEAGVDLYPAPGLSAHLTAFQRDTRNLIDYAMLTPADTVFLARNLLRVQTRGVEADLSAHADVGAARLRWTATYTFLSADLGGVGEGVTFKYALTNARHLAQTNAALTWQSVTIGMGGLWKERLTGERYGVLDARLAVPLAHGVHLTAEVRNLLNRRYAEVFDAPMPGRWWLLGLRWRR